MLSESAAALIAVVIRRIRPSFRFVIAMSAMRDRSRWSFDPSKFVVTSRYPDWRDGCHVGPRGQTIRGPCPNRIRGADLRCGSHGRGLARRRFCTTSVHSTPRDGLGRFDSKTNNCFALSHRYRASGTAMKKPDEVRSASQAFALASNQRPTTEKGSVRVRTPRADPMTAWRESFVRYHAIPRGSSASCLTGRPRALELTSVPFW